MEQMGEILRERAPNRNARNIADNDIVDPGEEIKEEFNTDVELIGKRRALPGEYIIFEIGAQSSQKTCQLTNYRVIQRQSNPWCDRHERVAVDAWLKDVTCVEVTKEPFSKSFLSAGIIMILGGIVNYNELGIHLSDDVKLGISMAPIGFYIFGLLVLLAGQLCRRTVLVLGVVGQNNPLCFTVPLQQSEVWKVNDCVDYVRQLQMPFALRKQREEFSS